MKLLARAMLFALCCLAAAYSQTIDDGIMMGRRQVCAGYLYAHDSWNEYWEGTLRRRNGNIGTLTTESHQIFANYGVSDKFNVIAHLPHVSTDASEGVLAGVKGFQDITLAAKYKFFDTQLTESGRLRAIAVVAGSAPMTDYTPDFLPLSIGHGSRRIGGRLTVHFRTNRGWFVNASPSYTWRDGVRLDRPYFYTDGRLTFGDRVAMPDVFDYVLSGGLIRGQMVLSASFSQQRTQGGGDIRRQDMSFVSNRMDSSRVGGWAKVPLPKHDAISIVAGYSYVVDGRNIGQSTSLTAGIMYLFRFPGSHRR